MTYETTTTNSEQTAAIGAEIARSLEGGETIELLGDLGAGKTTLTQGLVHALGFSGDVPSPTFTLSRDYPVKNGLTLRHFDLYRLSGHDIVTEELEEELNDAHSINVVEWAQHGDSHLPADRLRVTLAYGEKESDRQIIVEGLGERAAKIVEALK